MGEAVACHSKKGCWEAGAIVQVKDNEGKSKAIVVGVGIRENLEGDVGRPCWRKAQCGTGPMGGGLSGMLGY